MVVEKAQSQICIFLEDTDLRLPTQLTTKLLCLLHLGKGELSLRKGGQCLVGSLQNLMGGLYRNQANL